jgi:2-polyprenyl-6-methoxyphenol hydroxylase-like FAD-dependent oxidoreductase
MSYDVIISGAGPTGLMLACELRLHGVSVLVLERLAEPDLTIKAGAINTPSAEAFYRRGLLPRLAAIQEQNMAKFMAFLKSRGDDAGPRKPPPRFAGHFAGLPMSGANLDESDPDFAGHGPADKVGFILQSDLEAILAERAVELGAEIRRGVEVTGFETSDDITVRTNGESFTASWLVGADGGRSVVRKIAGFEFPGTPPEITGHQAIVEMEGGEALKGGWNTTPTGVYVTGPMPGRILTVEFDGPPADRDAPVTKEELEKSLRAVSGVDEVRITAVRSATRFTDNARQATTYRLGRVLLAGDAAHVHSPFGGQGLNLGIGDSVNLGWKLAGVVQHRLPEDILDTYTTERHPIGAWVLDWTRAQITIMRLDSHARALRKIMVDLLDTTAGTTYFAKKISGVWQSYDLPGDHPWIGRSAPDLVLADGTALGDHLHAGTGLLLDLGGLPSTVDDKRVPVLRTGCPDHDDLPGLLVRPDGIVAWAGGDGLDVALDTWFGAATAGA